MTRVLTAIVCFLALPLGQLAVAQSAEQKPAANSQAPEYETLFYKHDGLRLEAYFYKPEGNGPFPLVVYNHGSRPGEERVEWRVPFIARILVPAGYALLVPERRGYGKSEGAPFSQEIGADRGARFVKRLEAEAGDVNAAVDYAKAKLPVDSARVVIMGFSFGGMVTTISASRNHSFAAAIVQAPGALSWGKTQVLRDELLKHAEKIRVPMLCMVAENDATTESTRKICGQAQSHGAATRLIVYPPFTDPRGNNPAPGHALFTYLGASIWQKDVLDFLAKYAKPGAKAQ